MSELTDAVKTPSEKSEELTSTSSGDASFSSLALVSILYSSARDIYSNDTLTDVDPLSVIPNAVFSLSSTGSFARLSSLTSLHEKSDTRSIMKRRKDLSLVFMATSIAEKREIANTFMQKCSITRYIVQLSIFVYS